MFGIPSSLRYGARMKELGSCPAFNDVKFTDEFFMAVRAVPYSK